MGSEQSANDARQSSAGHFGAVIYLCCGLPALIAVVALAGWWAHIPALAGISGVISMKANTAVTVLLLAFGLLAKHKGGVLQRIGDFLTICALLLTLATLLEYATGRNLGIDQILAYAPPERAGDPAGRMSRGTALDGLLSAIALLAIDSGALLGALFGTLAALLSLSAVIGFLFDAGALLGVRLLRSMAPRTALGFLLLQLAFFLLRQEREPVRSLLRSARFHRTGGWFALGTCMLPLLLGWPVALLYRRGWFEAPFAFAVLVVLLMAAQAWLVFRNSRSMTVVEDKRFRVEGERFRLAEANQRQYTDLLASQERAEQSEAQYRLITDMLPSLISYLDRDLHYVRLNRTYEQWFGITHTEMEGKPLFDVLGPSTDGVLPYLRLALEGKPQRFEANFHTLQGDRTVAVAYVPDKDVNGVVRGVIVQADDITGRKHEEAALRQAEKLAAVGKLASSIAHEINNPLEAVTNLLYLASSSESLGEVRGFLSTAEQEIRRVSAIANQTLRFHKQSTRPVRVSAEDLFETVLTIYQGRLHNNRVQVECRHRARNPVLCLDGEIRQVLNNLVGNAIDALGNRAGRLLLRSRDATDWSTGRPGTVFTVADTGSGMSATTLGSLFEAFYTTKGLGGTGLGLWVSKEIVDRHEGRLRVRSSQRHGGSGTVFQLFLPQGGAVVGS